MKISLQHLLSQTVRARQLRILRECSTLPTCHVSGGESCHMSLINIYIYIFFFKVLTLVWGGSVINGATLFFFYNMLNLAQNITCLAIYYAKCWTTNISIWFISLVFLRQFLAPFTLCRLNKSTFVQINVVQILSYMLNSDSEFPQNRSVISRQTI